MLIISTAAVLHHQAETASTAHPLDWRRAKSQDKGLRNFVEPRAQAAKDLNGRFAMSKVVENHEDSGHIGLTASRHG